MTEMTCFIPKYFHLIILQTSRSTAQYASMMNQDCRQSQLIPRTAAEIANHSQLAFVYPVSHISASQCDRSQNQTPSRSILRYPSPVFQGFSAHSDAPSRTRPARSTYCGRETRHPPQPTAP